MTRRNRAIDAAVAELRRDARLSITDAAARQGVPRKTVSDALAKSGGRDTVASGEGLALSGEETTTIAEKLTAQGLDPAEWEVVRLRTGEWGNEEHPNSQFRFDAVPRSLVDLRPEPYTPLPDPVAPTSADRSFVICGDHHAPHQDPGLHAAFCSLLSDQRPELLVVLGDVGDYASVSKHRSGVGYNQGVKDVNRAVYKLLHDYRSASPDTYIVVLEGNHDARPENYLQDRAPEMWQVGPAYEEDDPMYSLRRMWRLDELGIELVDGDWDRASYKITDTLTARHGYMISKNAGETMLNKHGHSQVQGHDHRLKFTYKTKHDPIDIRVAISAACMCKIEDGLGYSPEPDWQQGCVVGHAWDDGDFALAPAPYVEGHGLLLPDGRRYRA